MNRRTWFRSVAGMVAAACAAPFVKRKCQHEFGWPVNVHICQKCGKTRAGAYRDGEVHAMPFDPTKGCRVLSVKEQFEEYRTGLYRHFHFVGGNLELLGGRKPA